MPDVSKYEELGRYLSQQRGLRGLSVDEVSAATKIPPTLIEALESGQFERLPARVFVVNYIRAYAQVIGLSPDEAVLRYDEVDRAQSAVPPSVLEQERKRRALRILAGVLLAVLVLAGAAVLFAR